MEEYLAGQQAAPEAVGKPNEGEDRDGPAPLEAREDQSEGQQDETCDNVSLVRQEAAHLGEGAVFDMNVSCDRDGECDRQPQQGHRNTPRGLKFFGERQEADGNRESQVQIAELARGQREGEELPDMNGDHHQGQQP